MTSRLTARQWSILSVVAVALVLLWSSRITDADIVGDAAENLRMALNLKLNGVVSLSEAPPIMPTTQREPLPVYVDMLSLRVVDRLLGTAPPADYFHGQRARLLKYQNILWLSLLSGAVFMLARRLGLSFLFSLLGVLATNSLLLFDPWFQLCMLNSLLTEAPAAALLALGSLWLGLAVGSSRLHWLALAGLCFGLLALVKALFLYIAVGLMIAIPCLSATLRLSLWNAVRQMAVLGAVTFAVVLPWMIRNEVSVGYFDIAGRGGEALHDRAVMDQMTRDEYIGSFYAWAPYPFGGALRRLLGYSKSDLDRGGRLQRLNENDTTSFHDSDIAAELAGRPQDAVTYYRRSRAEKMILVKQFTAAGDPQPLMAVDRELKRRAVAIVSAHPLRHAALTLTFLWRGGAFVFPPLVIAFIYAVKRRRQALTLIVLPALALVTLYTLASSFETRYAMPTYPIVMCVLAAWAATLWQRLSTAGGPGSMLRSKQLR